MTFDKLLDAVDDQPLFDLATLVQLFGDPRDHIKTQISRWQRAGRLISLRRGLYMLAPPYQRVRPSPLLAANRLVTPSYVSGLWCLSFLGLIPEMVTTYTSITTRGPRVFENPLGRFEYRSLKTDLFFGFRTQSIDGFSVRIARPEKALLDMIYLEKGEWTGERLAQMRLQNLDMLEPEHLQSYGERFRSPRISRAVSRIRQWRDEE